MGRLSVEVDLEIAREGKLMAVEEVLDQLRLAGCRITAPRRAIVQVVYESGDFLSPAEVYERARARCSSLGLVTVYRTLDLLAEQGLIKRVHLEDGCHSYAGSVHSHGHHLVCRECNQVVEFADCGLQALIGEISRRTGFRIDQHLLELVGICPECQQGERV